MGIKMYAALDATEVAKRKMVRRILSFIVWIWNNNALTIELLYLTI
jgi:hypothetical protein